MQHKLSVIKCVAWTNKIKCTEGHQGVTRTHHNKAASVMIEIPRTTLNKTNNSMSQNILENVPKTG